MKKIIVIKQTTGKSNSGCSCLGCVGCLASLAGIAGIAVASAIMGPVDLGRTVYNQLIGDTPLLKREIVNYCRKDTNEASLANELGYHLSEGEQINPQDVDISTLWDASEEHAPSLYQRWVWTSLED
ncbi:hypothetical protein HY490_01395 [Candidatus Woesearchaeota archaeon]|nr:hypothetical protein [Candidatus Woesearchaeota archaeon]